MLCVDWQSDLTAVAATEKHAVVAKGTVTTATACAFSLSRSNAEVKLASSSLYEPEQLDPLSWVRLGIGSSF